MKARTILHILPLLCLFLSVFQYCNAAPPLATGTNFVQVTPSVSIGPIIGQEAGKQKPDESTCQWLSPTLDFLKCLLWPGIVAWIVVYFRKEIRERLSQLQSAKTPAGEVTFREANAAKQMDGGTASKTPLDDPIIKNFVREVTKVFLRESSWNGLKIIYLCTECQKKRLVFDLKQVCEADGSMSYDYALGYIVASFSAQFVRYQTLDNVKFLITQVYEAVPGEITPAITGRLEHVGPAYAEACKYQLEKIKSYVVFLEANSKNS